MGRQKVAAAPLRDSNQAVVGKGGVSAGEWSWKGLGQMLERGRDGSSLPNLPLYSPPTARVAPLSFAVSVLEQTDGVISKAGGVDVRSKPIVKLSL